MANHLFQLVDSHLCCQFTCCRSLFQLSGCVLEVWGNLLVLTAILYALLHLGLRYGNLTLVPEWNGDCDQKFHEICSLLAVSGQLFTGSASTVLQMRFSNPKKVSESVTKLYRYLPCSQFYSWGLLISFLLYQLGCWLPTAVCLHGIRKSSCGPACLCGHVWFLQFVYCYYSRWLWRGTSHSLKT